MKIQRLVVVLAFFAITLVYGQSQYLQKYAGAYYILVTGYSSKGESEAYTLKADGSAVCYGYKDQTGKVQTQQKYGTWIAKSEEITVTIRGNTGNISETYRYRNGRFVNTEERSMYLKKI